MNLNLERITYELYMVLNVLGKQVSIVNILFLYFNKEYKYFNTKGPRIKHVCRTAESVLGQTLATFGNVLENSLDVDGNQSIYLNA